MLIVSPLQGLESMDVPVVERSETTGQGVMTRRALEGRHQLT